MTRTKKFLKPMAGFCALALSAALTLPLFGSENAAAASLDYPAQLMNIAVNDASLVLSESAQTDYSAVTAQPLGGDLSPSWRFDRVNSDSVGTFFKLINAESGRALTPRGVSEGADVVVYGNDSAPEQHWYVLPVGSDSRGNDLYYKIVNYSDPSLALTVSDGGLILSAYTDSPQQRFLLNADGLQGFAGYCADDTEGNVKASVTGGLFGETVEASTFEELKTYATSDEPLTIVVTANLSVDKLNLNGTHYMCSEGRIYVHSDKTIIGSYENHTLFNVQFCTSTQNGVGDNIIIRNFESTHDRDSNNNDSIQFYFGSGENIWVDHCTFIGHENFGEASNGEVDEDKFLACCYDADFCTISDCSFGAHKYGLILGYPADEADLAEKYDNYPRMSLISNKFDNTYTRGPGLMRWGYYHSLNNYVNHFSMAYTVATNCKIFAESCVYENGGNVICDWDARTLAGYYAEEGSSFKDCQRTVLGADSNSTAKPCTWRPNGNYTYVSLKADEAKNYCGLYSGCQSDRGNMMYLRFAQKGVPGSNFTVAPDKPARSAFETIEAEDRDTESGTQNRTEGDVTYAGFIEDGDSLTFESVDFEDGARGLTAVAAGADVEIELYLDTDTAPAALVQFAGNGDFTAFKNYTVSIPRISGIHTLRLVFRGGEGFLTNLDSFVFTKTAQGRLIRDVAFAPTPHTDAMVLADGAGEGSAVFGDRDFVFTGLPRELVGAEQILTACDDKGETGEIVRFTAAEDISVFVALDSRMTTVPAFLDGFEKTALTAAASGDLAFTLYRLDLDKGEEAVLSGNAEDYQVVNYTVLITPRQASAPLKGDCSGDGAVSAADAITLQKWLLALKDASLPNPVGADMNGDGLLRGDDLTLLKRLLRSA